MATGLHGVAQVLATRPVEGAHVRDKEHAPIHPPLEMAKTVKEVKRKPSRATHNHVSVVLSESYLYVLSLLECYDVTQFNGEAGGGGEGGAEVRLSPLFQSSSTLPVILLKTFERMTSETIIE